MYYKIVTPNPNFTGERAGVVITCGSGVTRDPAVADECRRMGYSILEQPEADDIPSPATIVNDSPLAGDVGAHGRAPLPDVPTAEESHTTQPTLPAGVQVKATKRKTKGA
jgi:hypothetical protein